MKRKSAELIVNIVSVLMWIEAIIVFLSALAVLFGALVPGGILADLLGGLEAGFVSGVAVLLGILLIALAIFEAFVAVGLWRRRNWARIALIVLSVLALFSWPLGTIVGVICILLFAFNRSIKSLFKRAPQKPARSAAKRAPRKKAKRKAPRKKAKRKAAKRKPAKKPKRKTAKRKAPRKKAKRRRR